MINVNLIGGPGLGKTTTAAEVFAALKRQRKHKVEYIPEYAKELTYANEWVRLSDQLHILGEQHHRLFRVNDKVDYIIHDSPIIIGLLYLKTEDETFKKNFERLTIDLFKSYNNLNILLERSTEREYQKYGRTQTEAESKELDADAKELLLKNNIDFHTIKVIDDIVQDILKLIESGIIN